MKLFKKINPITFPLFIAIYFFFALNPTFLHSLWAIITNLNEYNYGFIVSIPVVFVALFVLIFNLLSWPFTNRWLFPLLIVISSSMSYAMFNYGVLFDQSMFQNIVETNVGEASSYLNSYSILWTTLLGFVPAAYIAINGFEKTPIKKLLIHKAIYLIISALITAAVLGLYYKNFSSVGRNNQGLEAQIIPTDQIYNGVKFVNKHYFTKPLPYRAIGSDAKQLTPASASDKPTLFVFLLGETARANNFERQGYDRLTNQYTDQDNVTYFKKVSSCGTATALSVPCMFSQLSKNKYSEDVAKSQDNAIDILKHAGIDMRWLDNDGGDKGVAHNIPYAAITKDSDIANCNGSFCYDSELLKDFSKQVNASKDNRVLFYHLSGSHGPTYYMRYPQDHRFFTPDCPRSDIENCNQQELINTYDNTILYTDFIIHSFIQKLKNVEKTYNVALLYISDHGESLGENGLYLHGTPYGLAPDYQTHVPMMFWSSAEFNQEKSLDRGCLQKHAENTNYSQDNIYSSLIGIMDVRTHTYKKELDIFASCRS